MTRRPCSTPRGSPGFNESLLLAKESKEHAHEIGGLAARQPQGGQQVFASEDASVSDASQDRGRSADDEQGACRAEGFQPGSGRARQEQAGQRIELVGQRHHQPQDRRQVEGKGDGALDGGKPGAELGKDAITLLTDDEFRARAVKDLLEPYIGKRNVNARAEAKTDEIIAISRPRTSANSPALARRRSSPPSTALPSVTAPAGSRIPITA